MTPAHIVAHQDGTFSAVVVRDKNGAVINIGPWDDKRSDIMECRDIFDDAGTKIGEQSVKTGEHVANPFPDGATSAEETVIQLPDGGFGALVNESGSGNT